MSATIMLSQISSVHWAGLLWRCESIPVQIEEEHDQVKAKLDE